jgi:hypothetical protein
MMASAMIDPIIIGIMIGPPLMINEKNIPRLLIWSPTGKPVVPEKHTHLRPWALKPFRAQAPRLRWVIRRYAKSAEAWQIHRSDGWFQSDAFLHGQGRGFLRRRMKK